MSLENKNFSEGKIQQSIVIFYKNSYCLNHHTPQHCIFSVPNEGRSKIETLQKKAIGMMSGVSDLIILRPGEVIFVEVKTPTGTQSPSQKIFQSIVEALGFRYLLVRSLEQFKNEI
jgi:hypothetical protein